MQKSKLFKIGLIVTAAGLLIFLILAINLISFDRFIFITKTRQFLFSKLSIFGTFVSEIKKSGNLISENIALKEENQKLLSQLAIQVELKEQNDFLRQALDMKPLTEYQLTEARTYNLQFTPEGHYLLVNKGAGEGIKNDDVVISPSGVLIGKISEVHDTYSLVNTVTDPGLKITVKLLNNDTAAIARGILDNGLQLDFVSQNDEIAENDVIVTSGNDLFPAGLIVGSVSKISSDNSSLFKKVEVRAEFRNINISRVIIMGR